MRFFNLCTEYIFFSLNLPYGFCVLFVILFFSFFCFSVINFSILKYAGGEALKVAKAVSPPAPPLWPRFADGTFWPHDAGRWFVWCYTPNKHRWGSQTKPNDARMINQPLHRWDMKRYNILCSRLWRSQLGWISFAFSDSGVGLEFFA